MPALWRGRHQLLRATDDLWERARETESAVETARLLSEDKYDLDYQLDEEEGETFDRWQAELDGASTLEGHAPAARAEPGPDSNLPQDGGEPTGLIRYRIVAQRTDSEHPGAAVVTNYAYGRSVEEAVTKVRRALERPDGLYGARACTGW
ncbi:hypothetical protein [Streptomyces sp. NPDC052496]|uniref:hypothetical protein n=1 Tax=Streptomyces sp. NPDC052496 TaxID=3154951 RepID=UPI0034236942